MGLLYADGKKAVKKLSGPNPRKDTKLVTKNLMKSARFVETEEGSTLTFPNGDTVIYSALETECGSDARPTQD